MKLALFVGFSLTGTIIAHYSGIPLIVGFVLGSIWAYPYTKVMHGH